MSQDAPHIARIRCPLCGAATTVSVPTDACLYFYDCPGCGQVLRPNRGDCCVVCSFGDQLCPPKTATGGA